MTRGLTIKDLQAFKCQRRICFVQVSRLRGGHCRL